MNNKTAKASFATGLNQPKASEKTAEFVDHANAMLRWKQKTAAKGKLSEMEKHTSKCSDCGMKMKKCACASKTAMQKEALSMAPLKSFAGRVAGGARAAGTKVVDAGKSVGGKAKDLGAKAHDKVLDSSQLAVGGAGAGVGAAGGALSADTDKGQSRLKRALIGGALGGGAALGGKRLLENRAYGKAISGAKARTANMPTQDPRVMAQHEAARKAAKSGIKVPMDQMAPEDALRWGTKTAFDRRMAKLKPREKVKEAFIRAVNPTSAASSVNAQSGELVAKTASLASTGRKALNFVKSNPYASQAAIWGGAGAASGLVGGQPGNRLRSAVKGGITGAAGGAVAGGMMKAMKTANAYNERGPDPRETLAGKLPETGLPKPALDQHVDDIKNSLIGTVKDYRALKTDLATAGSKEKKVRLARPPKEIMEKLPTKTASFKDTLKFLKDPGTLAAMGIGGAVGGGGTYLASRPKKSLGGKSSAEVDLEGLVKAQKSRGEEGASFPRRLKNRYVEFSKGLSTDFRKSPGSAAAMGAVTGATAGALAAKMLGVGR